MNLTDILSQACRVTIGWCLQLSRRVQTNGVCLAKKRPRDFCGAEKCWIPDGTVCACWEVIGSGDSLRQPLEKDYEGYIVLQSIFHSHAPCAPPGVSVGR